MMNLNEADQVWGGALSAMFLHSSFLIILRCIWKLKLSTFPCQATIQLKESLNKAQFLSSCYTWLFYICFDSMIAKAYTLIFKFWWFYLNANHQAIADLPCW